jgi:8-oxo-dGTP diphosphatase
VEQYFPSASAINCQRYPSTDELIEDLAEAGFRVEGCVPTRTTTIVSTADLFTAVAERHNTTLRMIPRAELEMGLAKLRTDFSDKSAVSVMQAHTHFFSRKMGSETFREQGAEDRTMRQCPACGVKPGRKVAADVVMMKGGCVLLVKRAFPPDKGSWAIPGGYIEWDESPEDAARREVNEETGLVVDKLRLLDILGDPTRHPDQLITALFLGEAHGEVRAGDDAEDATWFPVNALPEKMALDHRDAVEKARLAEFAQPGK